MNAKIASAVTSVGILVAASTASLMAAESASAVSASCVRYLQSKNYAPTSERSDFCATGGHFNSDLEKAINYQSCRFGLEGTGVRYADAVTACNYAQTNG
ncbi:hypothetical protein [Streptomyces sp. NRRL B-1347]|uniref:hypothetical protein n=1 Tax=Streptomyces sp. NRRL B-1347 TaxID=1476877 RepID=UPI0004CBD55D|nr:hypothetical protein [Streptomyces sp. NRRL B-1347]